MAVTFLGDIPPSRGSVVDVTGRRAASSGAHACRREGGFSATEAVAGAGAPRVARRARFDDRPACPFARADPWPGPRARRLRLLGGPLGGRPSRRRPVLGGHLPARRRPPSPPEATPPLH